MNNSSLPPHTKPDTPTYRLLARLLGSDPLEYIHARRTATPPASFIRIASELREKTGEYVTHEAPRRWYTQATATGVETAATETAAA